MMYNLPDLQDKFEHQKELDPVLIFDSPLAGYFLPPGRKQLEASGGRNSTRGSSKSGEAPDFRRNYETIQKHIKLQIRVRPKSMQGWGERPGNARIKSMMKIEDSTRSLVQPLPIVFNLGWPLQEGPGDDLQVFSFTLSNR